MGNCVSRETGLEKDEDLNDKLERMRINIMLMKLKNAQTYHGDENQVEGNQLNKVLTVTKSKNTSNFNEELRITPKPKENMPIMPKLNEKKIVGNTNTPYFSETCKVSLHQPHFVLPFYTPCSSCSAYSPYMFNCCHKEKHKCSETNRQDKIETQAHEDKLTTNYLYEGKQVEKFENILTQSEHFEILNKKKEKLDFSQQIEKLENILSQSDKFEILKKKQEKMDFSQQMEKFENILSHSEKLEILKIKEERFDFSQQIEKIENILTQSEKLEILQKKQEKLDLPQKFEKLVTKSDKFEILNKKQEKLDFSQQVEKLENILTHSEKLEILQKNQEKLICKCNKTDKNILSQSEKFEILHNLEQAVKAIPKNYDYSKLSSQQVCEYQIILPKEKTYKKQTSKDIFELPIHKDEKSDNSCEKHTDKNFLILPKDIQDEKNFSILPKEDQENNKNFLILTKENPDEKNFVINAKEAKEDKNFIILPKDALEDKNFKVFPKEDQDDKNFIILPNQVNSQPTEKLLENPQKVKSKLPIQNIPTDQLTDKFEREVKHEILNKSQRSHPNDSIIYNRKSSQNIDESFMYHNENPSEIKLINYNTSTPQINQIANDLNEKNTPQKFPEIQNNINSVLDKVNEGVETPRYSKPGSQRFNIRTFETEDKQKVETPRDYEWQRKDTDSIMRIDQVLTEERESGRKTETARSNFEEPQFVTRLSLNNFNKKRFVFPKKLNNQEVVMIRPIEES